MTISHHRKCEGVSDMHKYFPKINQQLLSVLECIADRETEKQKTLLPQINIRYQYHLHHLKMQQTQILQIENELSTMSLKKSVSFSETTSTYNYPRPSAEDIDELYWQENDYRRFREQKWLDDLRRARPTSAAAPKRASRRDSLNMMMNDGPSTPTKQGIAQAA